MPRFAANLSFLFTELPFLDRYEAAAKAGFKAVEAFSVYDQPAVEVAARLKANGLQQILFNLPAGDAATAGRGLAALRGREADFEASARKGLEYAKALGTPQVHCMAGLVTQGANRKTFVNNLRSCARMFASEGINVIVEPLNLRDNPGYFLSTLEEARSIIYEVGEKNLGLQFDLYHRAIMGGDVAMAIREYKDIAWHYQCANPPDRAEPDDGEQNYSFLFKEVDASGYKGWIGCEYRPRNGTLAGLARWPKTCGVTIG
jgi:hydroxypyruvate isomerase